MSEGVRYRFGKAKRGPEAATQAARAAPPTALAMRLALAHYVERCIEDGTLASYADAARRLGITRARMTQVMDLLLLPGAESESILAGSSD